MALIGLILILTIFMQSHAVTPLENDIQLISAKVVEVENDYIVVKPDRCPNHLLKIQYTGNLKVKEDSRIMFVTDKSPCTNEEIEANRIMMGGPKR